MPVKRKRFFPEHEGLSVAELMQLFDSAEAAENYASGSKALWYEEIAYEVAKGDPETLSFFLDRLDGDDEDRVMAAIFAISLYRGKRRVIRPLLISFLADRRASVVSTAIDRLRIMGFSNALYSVLPLENHESPHVVGAVIRFLTRFYPESAIPVIERNLRSEDRIALECALDAVGDLAVTPSAVALSALLTAGARSRAAELMAHPHPFVRQAAAGAQETLATYWSGFTGSQAPAANME